MTICIGGTFDLLHNGHKKLLRKAFEFNKPVVIGITSDKFAKQLRVMCVAPLEKRISELQHYLKSNNFNAEIKVIDDFYGDTLEKDYDSIVVSPETEKIALKINELRKNTFKKELVIVKVDWELADDGLPISSTRIKKNEITRNGNLIIARVILGSKNPVKYKAVKNAFSKIYNSCIVDCVDISNMLSQPFENAVIKGAIERALRVRNDAYHFNVGIEAGLVYNKITEKYYGIEYCAIVDAGGRITTGHGPGFCYPEEVISIVKQGYSVEQAFEQITNIKNIGENTGAVGYMSKQIFTREQITENAVFMALIPRIYDNFVRKTHTT